MRYIAEEDLPQFLDEIRAVLKALALGMKKAEADVELEDDSDIAKVSGYWCSNNVARLDIKFRD